MSHPNHRVVGQYEETLAKAMMGHYGRHDAIEYGKLTLYHVPTRGNLWRVQHEENDDDQIIDVVNLDAFRSHADLVDYIERQCAAFRTLDEATVTEAGGRHE